MLNPYTKLWIWFLDIVIKYKLFSDHKLLSLGDAGLQIKLSAIRIPSQPKSIIYFDLIPIPMTILCQQSWFQYEFDIILIKVVYFRSIFDVLNKNEQLKDQNNRLKSWKSQLKLKKLIYLDFFNNYWSISISFWSLFDLFWSIWIFLI